MHIKKSAQVLMALIFVHAPLMASADMLDLPNPLEEMPSIPVASQATSQSMSQSEAKLAQVPRNAGGTLYTLNLAQPLVVDSVEIKVQHAKATLHRVSLVLSTGEKVDLRNFSGTDILTPEMAGITENTNLNSSISRVEILVESQGSEANLSVVLSSMTGATSIAVETDVSAASRGATSSSAKAGIVALESVLKNPGLERVKSLSDSKTFFSFTEDIYFYPDQKSVDLTAKCSAIRTKTDKAVRVPKGRLLVISISGEGWPHIFSRASAEDRVGVACRNDSFADTKKFIEELKGKVKFFYETPVFQSLSAPEAVVNGISMSLELANQKGIPAAKSLTSLGSLPVYLSFKQDILIFPNQDNAIVNKKCRLHRSGTLKEKYLKEAFKIRAGRKFRVEAGAGDWPRVLTKGNSQGQSFTLFCHFENNSVKTFVHMLGEEANLEMIVPKNLFSDWP